MMETNQVIYGRSLNMVQNEQLNGWLKRLRYAKGASNIFNVEKEIEEGETTYRVQVYTEKRVYHIVGIPTRDYLGCTYSLRAPLPGEEHTRGGDLPDGKFCEETFENIMSAIIGMELLELAHE